MNFFKKIWRKIFPYKYQRGDIYSLCSSYYIILEDSNSPKVVDSYYVDELFCSYFGRELFNCHYIKDDGSFNKMLKRHYKYFDKKTLQVKSIKDLYGEF